MTNVGRSQGALNANRARDPIVTLGAAHLLADHCNLSGEPVLRPNADAADRWVNGVSARERVAKSGCDKRRVGLAARDPQARTNHADAEQHHSPSRWFRDVKADRCEVVLVGRIKHTAINDLIGSVEDLYVVDVAVAAAIGSAVDPQA